jgi:hypothetical protein
MDNRTTASTATLNIGSMLDRLDAIPFWQLSGSSVDLDHVRVYWHLMNGTKGGISGVPVWLLPWSRLAICHRCADLRGSGR